MLGHSSFSAWALAVSMGSLVAGVAGADTVSLDASNDTWIRDGVSHIANGDDAVLDVRFSFVPYVQFDMSGLDIDTISSATLRLWKVASARNDSLTTGRFSAYGLDSSIAGTTLQNWDELDDFSPTDATNGLDFRNVGVDWANSGNGTVEANLFNLNPETGASVTESLNNTTGEIVLTGADLIAFLNTRADDNGLVTFILPIQGEETSGRGWGIASKEHATEALRPQLDLEFTAVPEPGSLALVGLGSLLVLRRRR